MARLKMNVDIRASSHIYTFTCVYIHIYICRCSVYIHIYIYVCRLHAHLCCVRCVFCCRNFCNMTWLPVLRLDISNMDTYSSELLGTRYKRSRPRSEGSQFHLLWIPSLLFCGFSSWLPVALSQLGRLLQSCPASQAHTSTF